MGENSRKEQEQYLKNDAVPGENPGFGIGWVGSSMNRLNKDAATLQYYYKKGEWTSQNLMRGPNR